MFALSAKKRKRATGLKLSWMLRTRSVLGRPPSRLGGRLFGFAGRPFLQCVESFFQPLQNLLQFLIR